MDRELPVNINFDQEFFKDEIRNDFYVSKKMKRTWAIELDLLNKLSEICKKYDIHFCLFAGSLLGAVRHKGFIPWDDDLDVCMDRYNYEKLLNVPSKEFEHPYFLQHSLSDRKYFFGYARLRNSLTTGIIIENKHKDYNNGIYIDIYVVDGLPNNNLGVNKLILVRDMWERFLYEYYVDYSKYIGVKKSVHYLLQKFVRVFFDYESLVKNYNKAISSYSSKANRLASITHPKSIFSKVWIQKEYLQEVMWVQFENIVAPIPKEYDSVLKTCYGDYMVFPPKEKRGIWHEGILIIDPDISYIDYLERKS